MSIAPRLLQVLDSLHEESPQVLDGSLSLAEFWSRVEEVESLLKEAGSTLAPLFEGGEGEVLCLVQTLFFALRQELKINRHLFPAVEAWNQRESVDNVTSTVFSTLGACSGDILDRHFRRLKALAELIGIIEESIDFAEAAYQTFCEVVFPVLAERPRGKESALDA